ncbi:MAG TPA: hypothetical protein VHG90_07860 [Acidimicrobiales bacterium]|nr:hypothetical protein [Acidimicrobiales bacterium]
MNTTKPKSFWSSIPGFVTGLAGILTGVVGLITVLIQLDVIGGGSDDSPSPADEPAATTETTRRSTRSGAGASQSGRAPQFSVSPASVRLDTGLNREADVVVRNTGAAGPLRLTSSTVSSVAPVLRTTTSASLLRPVSSLTEAGVTEN